MAMGAFMANTYIIAYFLSIVGGHVALVQIMKTIRRTSGQPDKSKALDFWLGGTERAVATTMVIIAPAYLGGFIIAWVGATLDAWTVDKRCECPQGTR